LKNQINASNIEANKFFDKSGQFIDSYDALQKCLPNKVFDSIRQILYGPKTDDVPLRTVTVERANQLNV
jgi:hypothetical protein